MNRAELKFESVVLEQFSYLESDFGLRRAKVSQLRVRFESATVFVEVYHGPKDYEVGIEFGRIEQERRFSFRLFLQRFFPSADAELGECLADTSDKVQQVTQNMSVAFRTFGQKIIENDEAVYKEMESVRWWDFHPDMLRPG